jgi:hypothetical protein
MGNFFFIMLVCWMMKTGDYLRFKKEDYLYWLEGWISHLAWEGSFYLLS